MLALVAAVVLTSSPSAAALTPRFVQVQAAALPGTQPTALDPQDPYKGWTRPQLESELRRLDDLKPGVGLPVSLLITGAVVCVIDFAVFFLAGFVALLGGSGLPVPVTAGIIVAAIAGAGLIIISVIMLSRIGQERRELGVQGDLVKAAIEKLSTEAPPPPPPPDEQPPPPPAFPSQVRRDWAPPLLTLTLARF